MSIQQKIFMPISIIAVFALSACLGGYSGPGMGKVMNQYCQSNTKFEAYYSCVNRHWYQPVSAAGRGSNARVVQAMSVGNNLLNGVRTGQITDADAIYRWQSTQMNLQQSEQTQNSREAAALQNFSRTLQNYNNTTNKPSGRAYSGQSNTTAILQGERTQGFSKICIYDRLGSVESLTIGNTDLCPITK